MKKIPVNKKYLFACILLGLLLCGAQIVGNTILILGILGLFMVLVAWCSAYDFTLPILLFFLPWSPIMRLNPTSFSVYTFAMVLVCLVSIVKKRFSIRKYQLIAGIALLFVTLLSKLLDGNGVTFDYIAFLMMVVLFPMVREERQKQKYDFYQTAVYFSLGIIVASLCAMYFAEFANIRKFIRVDSYLTILRRCGFYGDANFYVAQILAALSGVLALTLQGMNKKQVVFLAIIALFLLYCGFLSGSKSFALTGIAILLLWIIAILKLRGKVGLKIVLLAFIVCAVVYVATSVMFSDLVEVILTRFSSATDIDSLTTGRVELWRSYIDEIFGNVKVFFLGQGFTNVKVNGRASHNTILQSLYQFGLLGVPFVIYWIVCFYKVEQQTITGTRRFNLSVLMVLIGTFAPWMAIDVLFFDEFFLFQVYMCLALSSFQTELLSKRFDKSERDDQLGGKI